MTKAVRLIETFPAKADAEEAMLAYAAKLAERGDTDRFGVFVEYRPSLGAWAVQLLDRQYAPTRAAARNRTYESKEET